ncbi:ABC transporter substrate-binding protein [Bacillus sp. EB106-08-02-XG196]|uniref:ABC transporter substrate-binding protein n=1 Tax=Bacillus sp. EB106-08-02-XG196 TaxID=2737049 RepID=UPI0015C417A7|nr:ABC transporter substrate-binding protein [Bacillus sp. EB106-08-02-XG196]NWQ43420.1 ABC transporter substrate-binding protein [Bacillus sp. EB106-08-02-XG196]
MKGFRKASFGLILICFVLVMAACSSQSSGGNGGGASSDSVRIGVLFPLTGPLALLGNDSFDAVQVVADMVNEQGGVDGKKIKLVKADAPDATAAANEAKRLIVNEKVPAILGSYSSGISMAATQFSERNNVVYVEANAVSDEITSRGFKNLFRVTESASMQGKAATDFANEVLAPKLGIDSSKLKVVVMHEESSFGTSIAKSVEHYANEYGFEILSIDSYNSTTNDLSSTIHKYKKLNPDIVFATSYINDAILFVQQSKQLDFKPKAIVGTSAGYALSDFASKLGEDSNGIFVAEAPAQPNEDILSDDAKNIQEDFQKRWMELKGTEPTGLTWRAVNAAWVLFHEALPHAKSLDSKGIKEALQNIDIPEGGLPNGVGVKFNGAAEEHGGQNNRAKAVIMQWQDGKFKLVWPDKYAITEPIRIPLSN